MAGENPEDVERDEQGREIRHADEFMSKDEVERFQVLIMGPVMNILLALILTAVVLYQGVEKGSYERSTGVVVSSPKIGGGEIRHRRATGS